MTNRLKLYLLAVLLTNSQVFAATGNAGAVANSGNAAPLNYGSSLIQVVLALALVLLMMLAAAWFFKRIGLINFKQQLPVKVVGGLNLGNRERLMVVEIADQWLVLGVTSQQISTLATLEKQSNLLEQSEPKANQAAFADWLQKKLNKTSATPES